MISKCLLYLLFLTLTHCQQDVEVIITPSPPPPPPPPVPTVPTLPSYHDYILNITFEFDETKLSNYVLDLIYDEKSEVLTSEDVIDLFQTKTITLTETKNLLNSLNLTSGVLLSLNGIDVLFQELDLNFKEIYDNVFQKRLELLGDQLKKFLENLDIDIMTFLTAISFGVPDPYEEFKKGNFTMENLEAALALVDRTPEELFVACRDEFVERIEAIPKANLVKSLKNRGITRRIAGDIWKKLKLNSTNVYNVETLRNIVEKTNQSLSLNPALGILTSQMVLLNNAAYDLWKSTPVYDVYGTSFNNKTKVELMHVLKGKTGEEITSFNYKNLNISTGNVSYALPAFTALDLTDCKVIIPNKRDLIEENVAEVTNHGKYLESYLNSTLLTTNFILGCPLLCHDLVYGLGRVYDDDSIKFDSFYVEPVVETNNAQKFPIVNTFHLLFLLIALIRL